jgi:hypothetical protein
VAIVANWIIDFRIKVVGHVFFTDFALQFSSSRLLLSLFLAVLADLIVERGIKVIGHFDFLAEDTFGRFVVGFRFRCALHWLCLLVFEF